MCIDIHKMLINSVTYKFNIGTPQQAHYYSYAPIIAQLELA